MRRGVVKRRFKRVSGRLISLDEDDHEEEDGQPAGVAVASAAPPYSQLQSQLQAPAPPPPPPPHIGIGGGLHQGPVPQPLQLLRDQCADFVAPCWLLDALVASMVEHIQLLEAHGLPEALPVEWWAGIEEAEPGGMWLQWAREVFDKCGLQPPMVPSVLPLGSPVRSPEPYAYKVRFEELLMQRVHEALEDERRERRRKRYRFRTGRFWKSALISPP